MARSNLAPGVSTSKMAVGAENLIWYQGEKSERSDGRVAFHIPHSRLLAKGEKPSEEIEPILGNTVFEERIAKSKENLYKTPIRSGVSLPKRKEKPDEKRAKSHVLDGICDQKLLMNQLRDDPYIGFFYMVYAVPKSHELYSPYTLKIVDYNHVDKCNFITMSARGVTQYFPGEMLFTPLDQWETEYDLYCRIIKIKLFAKFRMWKAFYIWRKGIKVAKYENALQKIKENLFIVNPSLQVALLDIRKKTLDINDLDLLHTGPKDTTQHFFYWLENQMGEKEHVESLLLDMRDYVKVVANEACLSALLAVGYTPHDSNTRISRIHLAPGQRLPPLKDGKVKMPYTDQANKRRFCGRLACFIELCDMLLVDSYHTIIVNTYASLHTLFAKYAQIQETNDESSEDVSSANASGDSVSQLSTKKLSHTPAKPLYMIDVIALETSMQLNPPLNVVISMLKQLWNLWVENLDSVPVLITDPLFNAFTEPEINGRVEKRECGKGTSFVFRVKIDKSLREAQEKVKAIVNHNFKVAEAYASAFVNIYNFHLQNIQIDKQAFYEITAINEFKTYLEKFTAQLETLDRTPPAKVVGMLLVHLMALCDEVRPVILELLEVFYEVMPRLGASKVLALSQEVLEKQASLDSAPEQLQDFVDFLQTLEAMDERVEQIENEMEYCKELYDLCDEYGILISEEEQDNYLDFGDALGALRNTIEQKNSDKAKLVEKFQQTCNAAIGVLINNITKTLDMLMDEKFIDIQADPEEVRNDLNDLADQVTSYQELASEIKGYQKAFRVEVERFEMLDDCVAELKIRLLLWDSLEQWDKTISSWLTDDFSTLDPEEMAQFTNKNLKNVAQMEKALPENEIVPQFKEKVLDVKEKLPTITHMRNPNLKARHWTPLEQLLNVRPTPEEPLTLQHLLDKGMMHHTEEIQDISAQASSEAALETLLKKVEDAWKMTELVAVPHRDQKDVYILGGVDEIIALLEESLININTILSSRNVGPIKNRVEEWLRDLHLFQKTLDEWMLCQQSWLYLESIFSAPDIQRQLPTEAKMFVTVDKFWKELMRKVAKTPLAMPAVTQPGLYEQFITNNGLLEVIMKCLEAYLESKRVVFPRFYFLSNDELLEILAQTRNPHAVQPHLRKCFDAIAKLEFGRGGGPDSGETGEGAERITTDIVAMISPEGEHITLTKGLKARGNVEDWLGKVEEAMYTSLRRLMKAGLIAFSSTLLTEWVLQHASQIILTISQVMWSRSVDEILDDPATCLQNMKKFEKKNFAELSLFAGMVRGDLPALGRMVLCALITIDVHARDIITTLVERQTAQRNDFEWQKQLRYYWDDEIDNCIAKMSTSSYIYGYEYLGASPRLVITPLTDRCYLCLMGALQLDLGGAPAGPAGTGKTETTKDLAKSLAFMCVVFNCSEGLDFKMMGKFFSGLAQSGGWCCFDEFNRIDIEVLSVIAQQIITIRNAKAAKLNRFMFEGREIKLIPTCAVFITMNPGYAGRTELPDNLKALFRPISMMVPDYGLIAEVILYSEGFESSKTLAKKMVQMYKLCSEQLSIQDHYDFGMRAVKSVLVMAGSLKRVNPDLDEDIVLIRALRDSNLPKFLAEDVLLFQGILSDLFPGVVIPDQDYGELQESIENMMIKANLQVVPSMVTKIIQFHETCIVRHGVMLVGPTGGGKTTVLNILADSLTDLHKRGIKNRHFFPVHKYIMNPKAVTMGELYGEVNPATMEWADGLLGISVRTAVQYTNEDHQWIICDGPVDAVWIENMNTVLDDNKMLCLANSERIKLTPYVEMLFEVQDLAQASPATVSRCGMVYIDSNDLGWLPYVKSWLNRNRMVPSDMKDFVLSLFNICVDRILAYIRKNCDQGIRQVDIGKVNMLCNLYESLMQEAGPLEEAFADKLRMKNFLCQSFVFSGIWSLGGNITESGRDLVEIAFRDIFDEHPDARIPSGADLYGLFVNTSAFRMEPWTKIMPTFKYEPHIPFFDLLVPTIDTVRFGYLMERLITINKPMLFTGSTGVGKTVIAKVVLETIGLTDKYVPVVMNFSAQTSSGRTQEIIERRLEKKKKNILGGPGKKIVVLFIDDVNMPKLETYGAQPPIELLRQFLDFGGFYDREKLYWKEIQNVTICTACAPPGGGRNPLTPRFIRHFGLLLIPEPNEQSLKLIFRTIVRGFLKDFAPAVRDTADNIVSAAIEIYERISLDLLPTPSKSHYVFNLRDLSKCVQGLLQADAGTMREAMQFYRLFFHECLRVFHDRLTTVEDKSYFFKLLAEVGHKMFGNPIFELPDEPVIHDPPIIIFGDFFKPSVPHEDRIYEEITDLEKLKHVLQDYMEDYNMSTPREMKLILFTDAIQHTTRIARLLRAERGNGLLVGVGGMGKRNLSMLGAHLNGYKCFQIEITRTYDHSSYFEDLRKLYFTAGVKNESTVFLLNDTQIIQEEFLEDINNILNSGDVPGLFESDELEKVIIGSRPFAKEAGIAENNRDGIFNFFIGRVRSKLHLVLLMSPVGDAFRRRCRMFPSLVNCCTINWFNDWPQEALISVAVRSLTPLGDAALSQTLASVFMVIHETVNNMTKRYYEEVRRYYYTTPSSYLQLIKLFLEILGKKRQEKFAQRERIQNGLKKLYETNKLVADMKEELGALGPILKEKSEATEKLMETLVTEQGQAMKVRIVVEQDEAVAKGKAAETQAIADDAQADLDLALPAMMAATKALEALNKNDINELKVFNKPPPLVRTVMEAVCLLLGAKTDWATAKNVLGDVNFLKKLQDYDKDHISEVLLRKLKVYIDNKDFMPDIVATQSKVCKSICLWVRAIDTYSKVFKVVKPKKDKLEQAEKELSAVMSVLKEKQQKLADVEATIAKLEATYDASVAEKQQLEDNIALTTARLGRSASLTSALGDEQSRWETGVARLTQELNDMVGDVLIASAYLAYLGAFTSNYREELIKVWHEKCKSLKIPVAKSFGLIQVLGDAYEVRTWNTFGLPRDTVSTENAILVTQGGRWPLMIDPQEQANRWIRNMEGNNNLKITKLTDSNFLQVLETAIRLGYPVLLEDLDESLDPTLAPILLRQTYNKGGRTLIQLGDSEVDYDNKFRLFMTTKLRNPHYLPEVCIQVTIVNFTVTPSGLEDQLLADVVRLERPDLEMQRTELIVRINADKQQLNNIESKILQLLFHSEGNILDDEELIETLNDSKETSAVIGTRLEEAEETESKISIAREKYRVVAARGSCLYFVVALLGDIDPMYQYSLKYFSMIFNTVTETTKKSPDLEERLTSLLKEITLAVYTTVSRGLFERHKLIFSFLLCVNILRHAGTIRDREWNFLLRGPGAVGKDLPKKPVAPNMTEPIWLSVNYLSMNFKNLADLPNDSTKIIFLKIGDYSLNVQISPTTTEKAAKDWNTSLDEFSKLMVIRSLREEKLMFAITQYVKVKLGKAFVESPQINLHTLYEDTNNITPLIFVLSTGSDPFGAFHRFAVDKGYREKLQAISLGQGQGPIAEKLIRLAATKGEWVFLQNCHLASSWMLNMERLITSLAENAEKVHADYRLFLSSAPSKTFPVSVLQNSIKVTNEPPKGLRAKVQRAFADMGRDYFEDNPLEADWRKMIFGVCFFQAVVQERKKFGPLGWNIVYEFNDSDRECALLNLKLFCSDMVIPWDALEYITGQITYGGRVTDSWDQRCLTTILRTFFSPKILKTDNIQDFCLSQYTVLTRRVLRVPIWGYEAHGFVRLSPQRIKILGTKKGYKYSASGTYYCPESPICKDLECYRNFIDNLPIIEEPEIFGMHENANISFQLNETHSLLRTIVSVQLHQSAGGEEKSSDEIVSSLAETIAERILKKINTDEANIHLMKRDDKGRLPPLTTVLLQEIERFNNLLRNLHSSLDSLQKAIRGLVVMSDSVEKVYNAFLTNEVPQMWHKTAYPSLKSLASWVRDLEMRLDFVKTWLTHEPPPSFWMSGLFFPQGFLTGTLQTHARKTMLAIDQLLVDFIVQPVVLDQDTVEKKHRELGKESTALYGGLKALSEGVYIHGLFLDAARFETKTMKLADPFPGEMNPRLPVMRLIPCLSLLDDQGPRYVCPLYKTSIRAGVLSTTGHSTNFVISVQLPTDRDPDMWITRGCALLTQVTD